ncbi:hypothetical protein AVEN_177677-1 [Araneus ventricosus]|uniref:Uncharacterized protein n=1 Tax=Araneus ventricosus TaxID=182803 RepID=A0A4Y2XAP3_ARAVE|nr:hypothetical protein AVEN_3870-1 [Araneus ventricosus]GBO46276.1 hypothetical protein AVEN_177677-1 [Araneus ventricosus]
MRSYDSLPYTPFGVNRPNVVVSESVAEQYISIIHIRESTFFSNQNDLEVLHIHFAMNLMSHHIHICFINSALRPQRWRIITPQDSLWSSLRTNTHRNGNLRLIENASTRDESEVKEVRASKGHVHRGNPIM